MDMPGAGTYARASARVLEICRSTDDERTLRQQVVEELRLVVGFESYAWLLTDPATSVGSSPLAEVAWLEELPRQIELKYCTTLNRWTALDDAPVALLDEATGGDLAQSLVWRELLARHGVRDAASVVFKDRFGCWAFLELWRTGTTVPFSSTEATFLAELAKPLTLALRRCLGNTFLTTSARDFPRVGPVVLLLSPELQVRGQTPETSDTLRLLVPPAQDHAPIPASAYNAAAQLRAVEEGADSNPPSARVHLRQGVWVTVRAARIDGPGSWQEHDIAVTIEESSPPERVDLFARVFGLSGREHELLEQLVAGSTTRELARSMWLSENTVQDHLKSIFAKTSSSGRRMLLSRALGG
jgi:DNA-binding CsgD family transcriptional regulator